MVDGVLSVHSIDVEKLAKRKCDGAIATFQSGTDIRTSVYLVVDCLVTTLIG